MKKYSLILLIPFMISCGKSEKEQLSDIQKEIITLNSEKLKVSHTVDSLHEISDMKRNDIMELNSKVSELSHKANGDTPRYILELEFKQKHFSINPLKHVKDAMNASTFEIPVDKDYYDKVTINQELIDDFRSGSLIFRSSFGSNVIKVINKRTVYTK